LIYNEPAEQLYWRAPAAGLVLTGFVAMWCNLSGSMYAANLKELPDQMQLPLDTIFRFQPRQVRPVDRFWSVTRDAEGKEIETLFIRREVGATGAVEYRDTRNNQWRRSGAEGIVAAILVPEDPKGEKKARFQPRLGRDGTFTSGADFPGYYEVGGRRSMEQLGQVSMFLWGRWFLNILFNLVHFALWFACLWLLLRFQWPHALGLAVILWAAMTLLTLPMLLDRVRERAREAGPVVPGPTVSSPSP
jgi:hypothetical protein